MCNSSNVGDQVTAQKPHCQVHLHAIARPLNTFSELKGNSAGSPKTSNAGKTITHPFGNCFYMFIPPIKMVILGDVLLLFYPHYSLIIKQHGVV